MSLNISYNGVLLNEIGEVTLLSDSGRVSPEDLAQTIRRTIRVQVEVFQRPYKQNWTRIEEVRQALREAHSILQITNTADSSIMLDRYVDVASFDWPEDPNSWGQTNQLIVIEFAYDETDVAPESGKHLQATWLRSGGSEVSIGNVLAWRSDLNISRWNEMRSLRKEITARISVTGRIYADTTETLADRRTFLQGKIEELETEIRAKEGELTYGPSGLFFDRTVRCETFSGDINQAVRWIDWQATFSYVLHPDESNYSDATFTLATNADRVTGDLLLQFSGEIIANSESAALAKLASLRTASLAATGFNGASTICDRQDRTPEKLSVTDGDTFTRLTFNESYRNLVDFADRLVAVWTGSATVTLGNVNNWSQGFNVERNRMRSAQIFVEGVVSARGEVIANPALSADDRRTYLKGQVELMEAQFNRDEGTMTFGPVSARFFNRTCRITRFNAVIDQAVTRIQWELEISYTLTPDEENYIILNYSVQIADSHDEQISTMTFSGTVECESEASALSALTALRSVVLSAYGYDTEQAYIVSRDRTAENTKTASGTDFRQLSFSEVYQDALGNAERLGLVFTSTESILAVNLGQVSGFKTGYQNNRFHPMRDPRSQSVTTVSADGFFVPPDEDASVEARRSYLLGKVNALNDELKAHSTGVLSYGDGEFFNRLVKIDSFNVDIDQALTRLKWTAQWQVTEFPDEADYYAAEVTTAVENELESGESFLRLSGKIAAPSKAIAEARLTILKSAILSQYGFDTAATIPVSNSVTDATISSTDGDAYVELNLSFVWKSVADGASRPTLTFQEQGGPQVSFGTVYDFKDEYRANRYSEYHPNRSRAGGSVSANGEWISDESLSIENRRAATAAKLAEFKSDAADTKSGTLIYRFGSTDFFNRNVRIETFVPTVNAAGTRIKWSITCSYTQFPDENGFAGAEVKVDRDVDKENGDETLTISGTIIAANESIAVAKLNSVASSVLTAQGFTDSEQVSNKTTRGYINADDTDSGSLFLTLDYSLTYRRRASEILSYKLDVSDDRETESGFIRRTYSGTVVASGADADAAKAAALTKARSLGLNKFTVITARSETFQERSVNDESRQFVQLTFRYEYRLRGTRVWIQLSAEASVERFGDDGERISGFVIAETEAAARAAYQDQVRASYASERIRSESINVQKNTIENGTEGDTFSSSSSFTEQDTRLDFSLSIFKVKAAGTYAISYSLRTEIDYNALTTTRTIEGTLFASQTILDQARAFAAGNVLDTYIASLGITGTRRSVSRDVDVQKLDANPAYTLSLRFSERWVSSATAQQQLVSCSLTESITYSGVRWVRKNRPDPGAVAVMQDCGIEAGQRVISGRVLAATEAAAMAWVEKARILAFPSGVGGGAEPATRYLEPPRIERELQWPEGIDGTARGVGANVTLVGVSFTFSEILPDFPYATT